jgi:hypothetical protein
MRELIHIYDRTVDNIFIERANNNRRTLYNRSSNRSTTTGSRNNNNYYARYYTDISYNYQDISYNYPDISFNPIIGPRSSRYHIFDNLYGNSNYEDVVIRPTPEQILVSTEIINWSDNLLQTQCPISLDPFEDNERICRIRRCNHLFKISSLMNWFERNVRCPVCRYDIRDYQDSLSNNIDQSNNTTESNNNNTNNNNTTTTEPTTEQLNTSEFDDLPGLIYTDDLTTNPYVNPVYYNRSNTRNSTIRENLSTMLREFLTGELNRSVPLVNESVNDIFYAFNIPIEFDFSYTQII